MIWGVWDPGSGIWGSGLSFPSPTHGPGPQILLSEAIARHSPSHPPGSLMPGPRKAQASALSGDLAGPPSPRGRPPAKDHRPPTTDRRPPTADRRRRSPSARPTTDLSRRRARPRPGPQKPPPPLFACSARRPMERPVTAPFLARREKPSRTACSQITRPQTAAQTKATCR